MKKKNAEKLTMAINKLVFERIYYENGSASATDVIESRAALTTAICEVFSKKRSKEKEELECPTVAINAYVNPISGEVFCSSTDNVRELGGLVKIDSKEGDKIMRECPWEKKQTENLGGHVVSKEDYPNIYAVMKCAECSEDGEIKLPDFNGLHPKSDGFLDQMDEMEERVEKTAPVLPTKHSPAPWQQLFFDGDLRPVIADNDGYQLARIDSNLSQEIDAANLALILAAPEMLEALKSSKDFLAFIKDQWDDAFEDKRVASTLEKANEAIRKAEGK